MNKKSFLRLILPILIITIVFCTIFSSQTPVSAASCGGVDTSIIECGDKESGIGAILKTVINVMSIGIGILAVIGITVVGIQYLTAGANEEQTRKAKRRLIEIVIGIIAYILLYALLQWLIPGSTDPDDIPYFEPVETPTISPDNGSGSSNGNNNGSSSSNEKPSKKCTAFSGNGSDGFIKLSSELKSKTNHIQGYYLNIPQNANENTPIIIYLHGGGEAYANSLTTLKGLKPVQQLFDSSQFISIVPHSVDGSNREWTGEEENIKNLINGTGIGEEISNKLKSCGGTSGRDKYIMGMSDGANATWAMVQKYPKLFKAAAPVAGPGANITNLESFKYTRIVGVIGAGDSSRIGGMRAKIDSIKKAYPSMNPILIEYKGKDHPTITNAIGYPVLFNCLLSNSNESQACKNFGSDTTTYSGK